MLPGHQDARGSLAGEATGLVSLHAQLVLLGRCFWPLYRVRKNLSTQRPSPTTHHVFLKASAPRVKGFTLCLEKYFQLLSQQGKLENRTLRNSHSPGGEGNMQNFGFAKFWFHKMGRFSCGFHYWCDHIKKARCCKSQHKVKTIISLKDQLTLRF